VGWWGGAAAGGGGSAGGADGWPSTTDPASKARRPPAVAPPAARRQTAAPPTPRRACAAARRPSPLRQAVAEFLKGYPFLLKPGAVGVMDGGQSGGGPALLRPARLPARAPAMPAMPAMPATPALPAMPAMPATPGALPGTGGPATPGPIPALFQPRDAPSAPPGAHEGAYAWLTLNYLLGKLSGGPEGTVAAIDLGGGSVQEAFALPEAGAAAAPSGYVTKLRVGGAVFSVYVHRWGPRRPPCRGRWGRPPAGRCCLVCGV
jgi:hypothetical protein